MRHLLFFLLITVVINIVFITLVYGLYIPGLSRFEQLTCSRINETNSKAIVNCQKIIFDREIDGVCFFDKETHNIVKFDIQWLNLIIIFGTISGVSVMILLIYITKLFVNKIRKPS